MGSSSKDSAAAQYAYNILSDDQIRILVLEPGKPDEPLYGRLEEISLGHEPEYRAISYAWGNGLHDKTLHLDGKPLPITTSLFEALRRFREEKGTVALWADAVCINQHDIDERGRQVAIMANIYGRAQKVVVWLGNATQSDVLAFWTVRFFFDFAEQPGFDMNPVMKPEDPTPMDLHPYFDARSSPQREDLCCLCCSEPVFPHAFSMTDALTALSKLWQRSWFTRLWVLQEVALSRSCEFFCGHHHCSFRVLQLGAEMAEIFASPNKYGMTDDGLQAARVMRMLWAWREVRRTMYKQDFLDIVIQAKIYLKTSDARDLIYALRALPFPRATPSLEPDYSLPASELWHRLAVSVLTSPDDGDMSAAVMMALPGIESRSLKARTRETGLPTWAPDIAAFDVKSLWKYLFYFFESSHNSAGGPSRRLHTEYRTNEPSIMRTRGIKLTEVAFKLRESYRPWTGDRGHVPLEELCQEYENELIPWYLRCLSATLDETYGYKNMRGSFSIFLNRGRKMTNSFHDPERDWGQDLPKWVDSAIQADSSLADVPIDLEQILDDLEPFLQNPPNNHLSDPSCQLAITTDGHVAWVHKRCAAGDCVALFEGAPCPFVLREVEDGCFRVLGDAYVHGVMHGEDWPENKNEIREFKLV